MMGATAFCSHDVLLICFLMKFLKKTRTAQARNANIGARQSRKTDIECALVT